MKRILILICLIYLSGLVAVAQQHNSVQEVATPELAAQREVIKQEVVDSYLSIKNALLASDSVAAVKAANQFTASLNKLKFKKLTLEEMNKATTTRAEVVELASQISETKNISKQRKILVAMSEKFWTIADKVKPSKTPLYLQMCTMTGETWLSDKAQIENPIYPKNMLTCGMIKAKID